MDISVDKELYADKPPHEISIYLTRLNNKKLQEFFN